MTKKWSPERTISFLKGYEKLPCLWDVHSQTYKNRVECESAYKDLSQLMDIEGFGTADVKAKIRSLRNAYALEVAKIRHSKDVYKPKVPWFPVAHRILHPVVQIKETQQSVIKIEFDDSIDEAHKSPIVSRKAKPRRLTRNRAAPKRTKKTITEKVLGQLQEIARTLHKQHKENENEFVSFGKTVASHLNKLPEIEALESMAYIQSYLVGQRLKTNLKKK